MSAQDQSVSQWDVPCPRLRLALTMVLGIVGVAIFFVPRDPADFGWHLGSFPDPARTGVFVWTACAFGGALWVRRVERFDTPGWLYAALVVALALAAWPPSVPLSRPDAFVQFVLMKLMGALVVCASALALRAPLGKSPLAWLHSSYRILLMILAAPLFLFASRPTSGRYANRWTSAAFSVFPYVLLAGLVPVWLGDASGYLRRCQEIGFAGLSFTCFAWLGCSVLFLLNRWPTRMDAPFERHDPMAVGMVAFAGMPVLILLYALPQRWNPSVIFTHRDVLLLATVCLVFGTVLFFLATLFWGRKPLLGELATERRFGPLLTAILLAIPLASLATFAYHPFAYLISGSLFSAPFPLSAAGTALDQSTIGKGLFIFTMMATLTFSCAAIARWMSDRSTRAGYWAFAVPTVLLSICLLCFHTVAFGLLTKYVLDMGVTPKRVYGLLYTVCGYVLVADFLRWALRVRKSQ